MVFTKKPSRNKHFQPQYFIRQQAPMSATDAKKSIGVQNTATMPANRALSAFSIVFVCLVVSQLAFANNVNKCIVKYDEKCQKNDCDCSTKITPPGTKAYQLFMSLVGRGSKDKPCSCDDMCTKMIETDCLHGVCDVENKSCKCDSCWTGRSCDMYKNKHKPVFEKASYEHYLPADSTFGSVVTHLLATDKDTAMCTEEQNCPCAQVQYFLKEMKDGGSVPFHIDAHSGEISVTGSLEQRNYKFHVVAKNEDNDVSSTNDDEKEDDVAMVTVHVTGLESPHQRSRRSVTNPMTSGVLVALTIANGGNIYYNSGDIVSFQITLYHNSSVATPGDITNGQISVSSTFLALDHTQVSLSKVGTAAWGTPSMATEVLILPITNCNGGASVTADLNTTVKTGVQMLTSLYLNCSFTATDSVVSGAVTLPSVLSIPMVYGTYPHLSLNPLAGSNVDELVVYGPATRLDLQLQWPATINAFLKVELCSSVGDFQFMKLSGVTLQSVGTALNANGTQTASYQLTPGATAFDLAEVDYGYIQVGSGPDRNISVLFDVEVANHHLLENGSVHYISAGVMEKDRVIVVLLKPFVIVKTAPTLKINISSSTLTNDSLIYIGNTFTIDYQIEHSNLSTAPAKTIRVYVTAAQFSISTGATSFNDTHYLLTIDPSVSSELQIGTTISGQIEVTVLEDVNPLDTANILFTLHYKESVSRHETPQLAALAPLIGTPDLLLDSAVNITTMERSEKTRLCSQIVITKMKTKCLFEIVSQSANNISIFTISDVTIGDIGSNLQDVTTSPTPIPKGSGINPRIKDITTIDFGTPKNLADTMANTAENRIDVCFDVTLNDHSNITNGSFFWIGVGIYAEPSMILVNQYTIESIARTEDRPSLQLVPWSNSTEPLNAGSAYTYTIKIIHKPASRKFAYDLTIRVFLPASINFTSVVTGAPDDVTHHYRPHVLVFKTDREFLFADTLELTFNVVINRITPAQITVPFYLTYNDSSGNNFILLKAAKMNFTTAVVNTFPEPIVGSKAEHYHHGIAWNTFATPPKIYICLGPTGNRAKGSCFYANMTASVVSTWESAGAIAGSIIGPDTNGVLHGVSQDGKAYIKYDAEKGDWLSITDAEFTATAPSQNFLIRDANMAGGPPPGPSNVQTLTSGAWGVSGDGVYHQPSGGSNDLVAKWDCPSCAP